MHKIIEEGKAKIKIEIPEKISKEMEVFYNPVMKHNRGISVLLLNCINLEDMQIALPLSGTGIRGIRFLLELNKNKINFKELKIERKLNSWDDSVVCQSVQIAIIIM